MSTGAITGGAGSGALSLESMILEVHRSNAETQTELAEDAVDSFKKNMADAEQQRKDIRVAKEDVHAESRKLDEHIEEGPEWWDKFNPFTKGAIHQKQTEAQTAAVERESTDVAREQIELKAENKEVRDSLDRARDAVDSASTNMKDTTAMLEESSDVSQLILGRISV